MLKDPDVKAAFEKLKKSGKIKFCGLSCHDARLPEIVTAAAESGWMDQIMIQYNYRTMTTDAVKKALDAASKANLAIVAMKTQGGAGRFRGSDRLAEIQGVRRQGLQEATGGDQDGLRRSPGPRRRQRDDQPRHAPREHRGQLATTSLTLREQKQLEEYRQATAHLYCHGCGQHCEPAADGVAVSDILRYLRYHEVYGKRQRAAELYQALPPEARKIAGTDLTAAQAACPHGLPIVELLHRADRQMG